MKRAQAPGLPGLLSAPSGEGAELFTTASLMEENVKFSFPLLTEKLFLFTFLLLPHPSSRIAHATRLWFPSQVSLKKRAKPSKPESEEILLVESRSEIRFSFFSRRVGAFLCLPIVVVVFKFSFYHFCCVESCVLLISFHPPPLVVMYQASMAFLCSHDANCRWYEVLMRAKRLRLWERKRALRWKRSIMDPNVDDRSGREEISSRFVALLPPHCRSQAKLFNDSHW